MAYYTGTATDNADLLAKVRAHAILEGWTCSIIGSENYFEKDSLKVTLFQNTTGTGLVSLAMDIETTGVGTYNLGVKAEHLLNMTYEVTYNDPIISYHVFINTSGTPHIYLAIEIYPSIWRHIQFGIMEKLGTQSGGAFLFSHRQYDRDDWDDYNNGFLGVRTNTDNYSISMSCWSYTDEDGDISWAYIDDRTDYITAPVNYRWGLTTGYSLTFCTLTTSNRFLISHSPNFGTGETVLAPVDIFGIAPSATYKRIGRLPDICLVSCKGLTDGQAVTVGADTWRIFPVRANGYISEHGLTEETGYFGYAYKV